MVLRVLRSALAAGLLLAAGALTAPALAVHNQGPSDLFYNYYVPPGGGCGGVGAQLYVSPRPVPPLAGHTWITYQPLLPQEYMYGHCRTYYTYHPGVGTTKTFVEYSTFRPFDHLCRFLVGPSGCDH
jgi:hypothetical protein